MGNEQDDAIREWSDEVPTRELPKDWRPELPAGRVPVPATHDYTWSGQRRRANHATLELPALDDGGEVSA